MPFSGKATYDSGATVAETYEDISDIVAMISPFATPFLDLIGDAAMPAESTIHQWIEDSLLPNSDTMGTVSVANTTVTTLAVATPGRFRANDIIKIEESDELLLVSATAATVVTVARGYGGTTAETAASGTTVVVQIIGNAVLEGADALTARFQTRTRKTNYTQIFTETVDVSGTKQAVSNVGVANEVDYQVANRVRELLILLEKSVIQSKAPASTQQGSSSVGRSMNGLVPTISTNLFTANSGQFASSGTTLNEDMLNKAMRLCWEQAGIDGKQIFVLANGLQKRRINDFIQPNRRYAPEDSKFVNNVGLYDSDFGTARIILTRWVPRDMIVFGPVDHIKVLPLSGRSFLAKPIAETGDSTRKQIIGEYTTEIRNENAFGCLKGLAVS